ncbi:MAG TPA: M15 family metallopeptidase [Gaiellaceae bacterium]|nr:M15 family metallopeptidase [Gaiellaceae bacterium]
MRVLFAVLFSVAAASPAAQVGRSIRPLTAAERHAVVQAGEYHRGCPVTLSQVRVLTVPYWGFDRRAHVGQIVVAARWARPLRTVFRGLYRMRFPIRHMDLSLIYGPPGLKRPRDGDFTASFECRQAAASPCSGGRTGSWSMHAYGEAIDLDPVENPYVGCGQTRDPTAVSYMDRSRRRRGMVTPAVVRLFASIGWGWGGSWSGSTKDYMHFSANGH